MSGAVVRRKWQAAGWWPLSEWGLVGRLRLHLTHPALLVGKNTIETHQVVPRGWYMLELECNPSTLRTPALLAGMTSVAASGAASARSRHRPPAATGLMVYSGRMCKRVIYVERPQRVRLDFDAPIATVVHFRVLPITRRFAVSRVWRKLEREHPFYRSSTEGLVPSMPRKSQGRFEESVAWRHYNDLVNPGAELFSYKDWVARFSTVRESVCSEMERRMRTFAVLPQVTVLIDAEGCERGDVQRSIESVVAQIYGHWHLVVIGETESSADSERVDRILGSRIARARYEDSSSDTWNRALLAARDEWLGLLRAGDAWSADALFHAVQALNEAPDATLVYADQDHLDASGARYAPIFKPQWDEDWFHSGQMSDGFILLRRSIATRIGGLRELAPEARWFDFILQYSGCEEFRATHVARVLCHSKAVEAGKMATHEARASVLNAHFAESGRTATAVATRFGCRVNYALPASAPLVSLIIPTYNNLTLLQRCIESIDARQAYRNYEVIVVDNRSDDEATLAYLEALAQRQRFRVLRYDAPFNYAAINNLAVAAALGSVVGLLNNDVEAISDGWLVELVSHALRPDVGAVGARLLYSNGTVQHAGVVLGMNGVAGHIHRFLDRNEPGRAGWAQSTRSVSAVTGACLFVRRSVYLEVGGMDAEHLPVTCNDIHFCLRVREAGYRNVWTPHAELYHHESATRGADETPEKRARALAESAYMRERWGSTLDDDPAYNPNLSLEGEDASLAWPPRVTLHGEAGDVH